MAGCRLSFPSLLPQPSHLFHKNSPLPVKRLTSPYSLYPLPRVTWLELHPGSADQSVLKVVVGKIVVFVVVVVVVVVVEVVGDYPQVVVEVVVVDYRKVVVVTMVV